MTDTSVSAAFIKQYEREVHEAYQRQGSKLRNTVRSKSNVVGSEAIFQKVGKGSASTKTQKGLVPVMNIAHTNIPCTLRDYYAGDWVDRLDELKTNIDERQVIANAGAYALGRKTDELIIDALNTAATLVVANDNTGMTLAKVLEAFELLGDNDVPDDNQRFAVVGYKQWAELLQIDEFANSDFVGANDLPFATGSQTKKWMGTIWMPFGGLTKDANDIRSCFWYHKMSAAHASGSDVKSDITWHGDRASHFINNYMSQGAALIDGYGVVKIDCDESPD